MLSHNDFLEATRRFKDKKTKPHARTRHHALRLVSTGYSYQQTAGILFIRLPGRGRHHPLVRASERGVPARATHRLVGFGASPHARRSRSGWSGKLVWL